MEGYSSHIAQVAEISISAWNSQGSQDHLRHRLRPHVNPRIVESQIESGIIYGLSAALVGHITMHKGRVQQSNFNDYRVLRLNETPCSR